MERDRLLILTTQMETLMKKKLLLSILCSIITFGAITNTQAMKTYEAAIKAIRCNKISDLQKILEEKNVKEIYKEEVMQSISNTYCPCNENITKFPLLFASTRKNFNPKIIKLLLDRRLFHIATLFLFYRGDAGGL